MADINVERKKKSIWPWILGAIALLLLIWAFAAMNDRDAERVPATTATTPAAVSDPGAIDTATDTATDTTAVTADAADTTTETPPPPTE